MFRRWRLILALALLWLALTISSAWVHRQLWTDPRIPFDLQQPYIEPPPIVRGIGSLQHIILGPGWAISREFFGTWPTFSKAGALVSSGLGWAICFAFIGAVLFTRRMLIRLATRPRADAGPLEAKSRADHASAPKSPARRKLLIDTTLAATTLAASGTLAHATLREPWRLVTRRYRLTIADLPAALQGTRIVLLADTHLGPRVPASFIADAVNQAIALRPHLFALLGDYIHDGISHIAPAAALFKPLVDTGTPVVAVLGNHDWYGHGPRMAAALKAVGITMLDQTRVLFNEQRQLEQLPTDASTPRGIALAGWGDLLEDHINVDRSLGNLPADLPRIVLSHNPDASLVVGQGVPGKFQSRFRKATPRLIDSAKGTARIDAMLSGHTHGGQVSFPFLGPLILPSRFGQRFAGGICQGPSPASGQSSYPVVVTRGIGMSILPIRFNCPPEIVEVELV